MKYYPFLSTRDAEIKILKLNRNNNVIPHLLLIKEKYRVNSKRNLIEDLILINKKVYIEIFRGTLIGNTQSVVKEFANKMQNIKNYLKIANQIINSEKLILSIRGKTLMQINREDILNFKKFAIKFDSIEELISTNLVNINYDKVEKIFIRFNPTLLSGTGKEIFNIFYAKNNDKICFVFQNHKNFLTVKKSQISKTGKIVEDDNWYYYSQYNVESFGDYCTLKKDALPATGGTLAPSISIPLDQRRMFIIGSGSDALQYENYSKAAKNMYQSQNYKSLKYTNDCETINFLEEANIGKKKNSITPLKGKIITMDHYINMIINEIINKKDVG